MSSNRQAGGHKANLNNPNTSEESKERSRQALDGDLNDSAQYSGSNENSRSNDHEGKNPGNVAGGYKATLKNPNVSDEAKQNAEQQLKNM